MECPHLDEHVKVGFHQFTNDKPEWKCAECSSSRQPWMCLYCGVVNCSRYVCGHALSHSETNSDHNICIDCESTAVYCYRCDDYVVNDTKDGLLSRLKQTFIRAVEVAEEWDPPTHHNLRPRARKRSHSNDSSSTNSGDGPATGTTAQKRGRQKRKSSTGQSQKRESAIAKREKKVVGLRNLGNTCFMNAVLQSLSNIEEFCHYFKQLPSLEGLLKSNGTRTRSLYQSRTLKELNEAIVAEELRKVLVGLSDQSSKGAISPESLFLVIWKVVPRYRGYQQQDAHEFLRYMLDRLHTELLHLLPGTHPALAQRGRSSVVTTVFGGTLQSEVRCLNCGTESKKHDPFLDLSLDIPERVGSGNTPAARVTRSQAAAACGGAAGGASSGGVTVVTADLSPSSPSPPSLQPVCHILDCLTSFVEVEELAETELYYCNNCKSKQRSTKRFWIRRLPNVLCLHLKRFRWNNFFRTKVDTEIAFPTIALDMSQFVLEGSGVVDEGVAESSDSPGTEPGISPSSNLYDLAAVIVHHGGASGSGHYTAFAINDGQWFHFNDSMVRPTDIEIVAKCKPYIMFYIRREFKLPSMNPPSNNGEDEDSPVSSLESTS